jgi:hypothetical protein
MQLAFTLKHNDWPYIERRGGIELLTHLRGAPARVAFRRAAITRALDTFSSGEAAGLPEPELGGLGLIVVQRALLAAEDLGGLLHAFHGDDPWGRLRATTIPDIDSAYEWALANPEALFSEAFCLADDRVLRKEGLDDVAIHPLLNLRQREVKRWVRMLESAASLWSTLHGVAKATMHGFPVFAGTYVFESPGGGQVGAGLRASPFGRCAIAASSIEHGQEVRTDRLPVRLDREGVAMWARWGKVAASLAGDVCAQQAESRMRGYAGTIPLRFPARLNAEERRLVEGLTSEANEGR